MIFYASKSSVLLLCFIIIAPYNVECTTYECEVVEKYDNQGQTFCVFRDVQYTANTTDIVFKTPKVVPARVVFENSQIEHLPKEFLNKFGADLKVLNVTSCNLTTVVVTKSMEQLIATDNYIDKIIVHQTAQNSPMKELHLPSNRLADISNITRHCKHLRILDLSRNQMLAKNSELDFSVFNGLDQLEYLSLADVGAFYILSDKKVSLPSLTLLDLSVNNLISVDLHVDYFQSFKNLEVLRLNSNGFNQLDYNDLTGLESLKQVYLEGNEFSCSYLKTMIKHLNDNGKQTPVARPAAQCPVGYNIEHQMCCRSESLTSLPDRTKPSKPPTSDHNEHVTVTQPSAVTAGSITTKKTQPVDALDKNSATCFVLNLRFAMWSLVIGLFWSKK
ncbi:uncharacterized protein LOC134219716 [Armigeres subalbatus]|uniref:uncharacterized protein LOC134219716 n=1 Tax=Armigeres subalbatus TaxID=124917 RepID=UPI002ED29FFC